MSQELEYKFVHAREMEKRFSRKATKVFLKCGASGENTGKEKHLFLPFPVFLLPAPHPRNAFVAFPEIIFSLFPCFPPLALHSEKSLCRFP
jgi:hypothetical protein